MAGIGESLSRLHKNTNFALGPKGTPMGKLSFNLQPDFPTSAPGIQLTKNVQSAQRGGDKVFGIEVPDQTVPTPVTPMPIPGQDDLANIAARRRSIEQQLFRRGRLSTVLTSPTQTEPLGA